MTALSQILLYGSRTLCGTVAWLVLVTVTILVKVVVVQIIIKAFISCHYAQWNPEGIRKRQVDLKSEDTAACDEQGL
jgi:hypothetical protein